MLLHASVPPDGRETVEITYPDGQDLAKETSVFEATLARHAVRGNDDDARSAGADHGLRAVVVHVFDARCPADPRPLLHGRGRRAREESRRHSRIRPLAAPRRPPRRHRTDADVWTRSREPSSASCRARSASRCSPMRATSFFRSPATTSPPGHAPFARSAALPACSHTSPSIRRTPWRRPSAGGSRQALPTPTAAAPSPCTHFKPRSSSRFGRRC